MSTDTLELKEGSKGKEVTLLQQNLKKLGFYTGAADGIFGPATKASVIKFQQSHESKGDGIVGEKTRRLLDVELYPIGKPTLKEGSKGEDVKTIQGFLKSPLLNNIYTGASDGIFGAKTTEAVIKAQKGGNIKADGIVGQATWKYLYAISSHYYL
jgi:peptidoglycan hydrolase-like protein with peptidoglycan-binding domain